MDVRRRVLVAVTAVVALAVPVVGQALEDSPAALRAEVRFLDWADTAPAWVHAASRVLAVVFDPPVATVMVVGIGAGAWMLSGRWRAGLAALVVMLAPIAYVFAVKYLIARPRPPEAPADVVPTDPSFPSGHTACAVAVCVYLGWVAWHRLARSRPWVVAFCVAVPLCVAASRVVLGVHHVTDVLASLVACPLIGWLAATCVAQVVGRVEADGVTGTPGGSTE